MKPPGLPAGPAWRVLRNRDYSWYFAGNACSNVGTWLQNTAQALLAYRLTRSAGGVAAVTFAQFAGVLVLGPWAGTLADRADRRKLLLVSQILAAAAAAGLAAMDFTGLLTQSRLVAGAAVIGVIFAFTFPAQSAIVPSLVAAADVRPAMAMNVVSDNVGRALAPAAGVVVISTIGFGWAFAVNALSFLVFAALLMRVRCRRTDGDVPIPRQPARFLDGLRIAVSNSGVRQLLVIAALTTVATDPIMVLGPSIAHGILHVPAVRAGYFIAAFGMGTVLGALVRVERFWLRDQLVWSMTALFGSVLLYCMAPGFFVSLIAAFIAGVAFLVALAATQTSLLRRGQPGQAGSMMAIWAFAHVGSRPPASLIDGRLAGAVGPQWAGILIIAGAACVLACVGAHAIRRTPRRAWPSPWRVPAAAEPV